MPARTLSSILDELAVPAIDFLSLDVEGYELEVLRGLDLDRHAPRHLLVEILEEHGLERAPIRAQLAERYEEIDNLSHHDVLFRLR